MATDSEIDKHGTAIETFKDIADGAGAENRRDVFNALWSFWCFEHALDDVIDSGVFTEAERETLLHEALEFVERTLLFPALPPAPFFTRYTQAVGRMAWPEDQKELAHAALVEFASNLGWNPFYQKYAQQHLAMFQMCVFRAIAGDEMAASLDDTKRTLAPSVRCADIDFVVHVAYLAGGWTLARKITSRRDYDLPD
jgi:hypothetical protein